MRSNVLVIVLASPLSRFFYLSLTPTKAEIRRISIYHTRFYAYVVNLSFAPEGSENITRRLTHTTAKLNVNEPQNNPSMQLYGFAIF